MKTTSPTWEQLNPSEQASVDRLFKIIMQIKSRRADKRIVMGR